VLGVHVGRKLRLLLKSEETKIEKLYDMCKTFFESRGYKLIDEKPYEKLVFKGGSKFFTYIIGTHRWSKALKTAYVTFIRGENNIKIEVLWDVSLGAIITSPIRYAKFEIAALVKALRAKVIGYRRT